MLLFALLFIWTLPAGTSLAAEEPLTGRAVSLGKLPAGYSVPALPRDIAVSNSTAKAITISQVKWASSSAFAYEPLSQTVPRKETAVIGTVLPQQGLRAGHYEDTLMLYGASGDLLGSVRVTFDVTSSAGLSITVPAFGTLSAGYGDIAPAAITLTNTGMDTLSVLNAGLRGTNAGAFALSGGAPGQLAGGKTNTSWHIAPVNGLSAGQYAATVVITAQQDGKRVEYTQDIAFGVEGGQSPASQAPILSLGGEGQPPQITGNDAPSGEQDFAPNPQFAAPESSVPQPASSGGAPDFSAIPLDPVVFEYEATYTTGITSYANVRSGPGREHDVIGAVYPDEEIWLVRWNADETWCEVYHERGRRIGWLKGDFILPPPQPVW